MTTPGASPPDGSFRFGTVADAQGMTESWIRNTLKAGAVGTSGSYTNVQNAVNSEIKSPLGQAVTDSSVAVSAAEAAANDAAAADQKADIALGLSSYWEAECVVASAEVLLGVNELLIGLCQNVPDDRVRSITDLHIALVDQPGGMQVQTKKWNAAGTSNSVVHTATLGANVTRINYNNLDIDVADKERVYWNVTSITGSVAPNVLQCLVFGVILGE